MRQMEQLLKLDDGSAEFEPLLKSQSADSVDPNMCLNRIKALRNEMEENYKRLNPQQSRLPHG